MAAPTCTKKPLTALPGGAASGMHTTDVYSPGTVGAGADTNAYPPNQVGARAFDKNGNEFILLAGAASMVEGDAVIYNPSTFATTRLKTGAVGPVAFAQAAVDATTKYGWFLIKGYAERMNNSAALAINAQLYVNVGTSTGGVTDTYSAGAQIHGAVSVTSSTSDTSSVSSTGNTGGITGYVSYPYVNAHSDS